MHLAPISKEMDLKLRDKHVAIIGAGIAGLAAADELSRWGIQVTVFEKTFVPGGHAARFSCKAVDGCVRCGACLVQDRLRRIARRKEIKCMTGARIMGIRQTGGYELDYSVAGAGPGPEDSGTLKADALLLASGFSVYDPSEKPYGYGKFADVITNLEAERILCAQGGLKRPSDGQAPRRIAFIQCVGSRDSRIGRNWCSKICCGSALRMARLIQKKEPAAAVTFFYIDVQSFGRDFQTYFAQCREHIQSIRAIPGDIVQTAGNELQLTYFDPQHSQSTDQQFDMVILSVGMAPSGDLADLAAMLGRPLPQNGFWDPHAEAGSSGPAGLFAAGAVLGPMSIAESIDSAGKAVWGVVRYLDGLAKG
ncbi:MAG: CoB--CoM heterodisulfide reductase iron-sulfur subunit A family protein [Desulfobacteraceae bacterium]|nr:MAG: CoB--CoM heterodisulfide reductase iron-sulfur subunit A family protein [Desulfobacteraceae bacterium]